MRLRNCVFTQKRLTFRPYSTEPGKGYFGFRFRPYNINIFHIYHHV